MNEQKLEKYSAAWKKMQTSNNGGWAQKHVDCWRWHFIEYDTEYRAGKYFTKSDCCKGNKKGTGHER